MIFVTNYSFCVDNLPTLVLDFIACCTLFMSVMSTLVTSRLNLDETFEKYLFTPTKNI